MEGTNRNKDSVFIFTRWRERESHSYQENGRAMISSPYFGTHFFNVDEISTRCYFHIDSFCCISNLPRDFHWENPLIRVCLMKSILSDSVFTETTIDDKKISISRSHNLSSLHSSIEMPLTFSPQSYFAISLAEERLVRSVHWSWISTNNVQLFLIQWLPFSGILLLMASIYGWPRQVIVELISSWLMFDEIIWVHSTNRSPTDTQLEHLSMQFHVYHYLSGLSFLLALDGSARWSDPFHWS